MRSVAALSAVLVLAGCASPRDRVLFAPYPDPAYAPPQFSRMSPVDIPSSPYAVPPQDTPPIGIRPPGPTPLVLPSMAPPAQPVPEDRPPIAETSEPTPSFERPNEVPPMVPDPDEEEKRARMYRELHGDPSP